MSAQRKLPKLPPASEQIDAEISRVRTWVNGIVTGFNVRIPGIAKRSGVSASTIYRWFREDETATAPDLASLVRIANAFGVPLPTAEQTSAISAVSDGDVQLYEAAETEASLPHNQSLWIVRNRALDLAGYLPGDIVRVDMSVAPTAGDVVFAQVYNLDRGTADTLMRIYSPPYLVSRSSNWELGDRPLLVDNERVAIMGTVISMTRERP